MKHSLGTHMSCVFWLPLMLLKLMWLLFLCLCSVGAVMLSNVIELLTGRCWIQNVAPTFEVQWDDSELPRWFGLIAFGGINTIYKLRDFLLEWLTFPCDSGDDDDLAS